MSKRQRLVLMGMSLLFALGVLAGVAIIAYPTVYDGRIYPGVSAGDVDLGGLTVEQATNHLIANLPDPTTRGVQLRADDQVWQLTWADAGKRYDYAGTAVSAYYVARDDLLMYKQTRPALRTRQAGAQVTPMLSEVDPARVVAELERLAPALAAPAIDAHLEIKADGSLDVSPGQTGRQLDVQTSAARALQALEQDETGAFSEVELAFISVLPNLTELEPAHSQAQALLAQPFVLVAQDLLTNYYQEFVAPPERIASWLQIVARQTDDGPRMDVELDGAAIREWLREIASQVGGERALDADQSLPQVLLALNAGEYQIQPHIYHPQGSYVVQPGDYFFDIAYSFGFPQWQLEKVNPDVDPEGLEVGMELVIPSIDVLFPEPIVPGKRIEIDLPAQRLRAYKDDELVYDLTCSSGVSETPTLAGQFQVIFKEEVAYAPRWDLDMPYFIAIYEHAEGFYNGVHELPILSSGTRLWASVLGWPASYGCIILDIEDAETIYNWAPIGTLVKITGVAPDTPNGYQSTED